MEKNNDPERLRRPLMMHGLTDDQISVVLRSYRTGLKITDQ